MARPKSPVASRALTVRLSRETHRQVEELLYSELEGRVPHAAYKEFFDSLIRGYFQNRSLPLEPFGFPQGYCVQGHPEVLAQLTTALKEKV